MQSISVEEAQSHLAEIIDRLAPGAEIVITRDAHPVARLVAAVPESKARILGTLQGTVQYMAPDFDAPLEDFKEYMP